MSGWLDLPVADGDRIEFDSGDAARVHRKAFPKTDVDAQVERSGQPYLSALLARGWHVAAFDHFHAQAVLRNGSDECLRLTVSTVMWPEIVDGVPVAEKDKPVDAEPYPAIEFERGQCDPQQY